MGRLAVLPILLLAMLLQADAVVRSLVMQAAPGDMAPICTAHVASISMPATGQPTDQAGHATPHSRCPYCEVAAHVAVFVAPPPLPLSRLVAFATFETLAAIAPPTSPAILAKARDPPGLA